jgi:hypothetical protein
MPMLPEIVAAVSFLQLDLSLLLSLVLSTRMLQLLSFSLNKTAAASTSFLFLASHQKSLGLSPRFLQLPRMGAPICLNQPHEGR